MPRDELVLRVQGLRFGYVASRPLFSELSFTVAWGDRVAISGPSGSGKSTLLSIIAGIQTPDAGSIEVHPAVGRPSWVLQVPIGVPRRSAGDHVGLVLAARGAAGRPATDAVLTSVGLADRRGTAFGSLSGGEAQRLMVAMSLACGSRLVLLDEPTSQLDRASALAVVETIDHLALEKTSFIIATHDPQLIAVCDAVVEIG